MDGAHTKGTKNGKKWRIGLGCMPASKTAQQLITETNSYKGTGKFPGSTAGKSTPSKIVKCGSSDDCQTKDICKSEVVVKLCPTPKDLNKVNQEVCEQTKWDASSFRRYDINTTSSAQSISATEGDFCSGTNVGCAVLITEEKTKNKRVYPLGCQNTS